MGPVIQSVILYEYSSNGACGLAVVAGATIVMVPYWVPVQVINSLVAGSFQFNSR